MVSELPGPGAVDLGFPLSARGSRVPPLELGIPGILLNWAGPSPGSPARLTFTALQRVSVAEAGVNFQFAQRKHATK